MQICHIIIRGPILVSAVGSFSALLMVIGTSIEVVVDWVRLEGWLNNAKVLTMFKLRLIYNDHLQPKVASLKLLTLFPLFLWVLINWATAKVKEGITFEYTLSSFSEGVYKRNHIIFWMLTCSQFSFSGSSKLIGTKKSMQHVQVFISSPSQDNWHHHPPHPNPHHHQYCLNQAHRQEFLLQLHSSPDTHWNREKGLDQTSGEATQGFNIWHIWDGIWNIFLRVVKIYSGWHKFWLC